MNALVIDPLRRRVSGVVCGTTPTAVEGLLQTYLANIPQPAANTPYITRLTS